MSDPRQLSEEELQRLNDEIREYVAARGEELPSDLLVLLGRLDAMVRGVQRKLLSPRQEEQGCPTCAARSPYVRRKMKCSDPRHPHF